MEEIALVIALFCSPAQGVAPGAVVNGYHAGFNAHDVDAMALNIAAEAPIDNPHDSAAPDSAGVTLSRIAHAFRFAHGARLEVLNRAENGETIVDDVLYGGNEQLAGLRRNAYVVRDGCIQSITSVPMETAK